MARFMVLHAARDKTFAELFIKAARQREPDEDLENRDNIGAFALDVGALSRYDALIALLSPEALDSSAIVRLLEAYSLLADRPLIAVILRPVALPGSLHPSQIVQAESLAPDEVASIVFPALRKEALPDEWALEWDLEAERALPPPPPQPSAPPVEEPGYGERGSITGAPPPPAPAAEPSAPPPPPPPPAPGALPPDVVGAQPSAQPPAQPSAPPATRGGTSPATETLQFSAYHPNEAPVEVWQTLLVYAYLPEHLTQVQADAGTFTELGSSPALAQGQSLRKIARNVEITIEPHAEGVTFSPPQDSFIWRGEWHRSLFRYSGAKTLAGTVQKGWIDVYAERIAPICTIEVAFSFHEGIAATSLSAPPHGMAVTTSAFDTVFISYSHRDSEAMRQALETYRKMNITVYNDDQLPSGVNYERELARMIEAANVFHLLWSNASAHSPEVRKECLRALASQKGERFIRPWYWQQPLVTPPAEMQARRISFRYERLRRRLLRPSTWF